MRRVDMEGLEGLKQYGDMLAVCYIAHPMIYRREIQHSIS
jgi:hypothetical protein